MSAADLEKQKKKQMIALLEAVKDPKAFQDCFNIFRERSDTYEVTPENFVKVINQLVPSIPKDEILPILQDYQKPDQGMVNYGLFLENLNKIKQKKKVLTEVLEQIVDKSESKIQDLFDLFASVDTNKNGFISRKEFLNMFNDFGIYYDEDQIDDFFFFLDTNSDNQLSYKELQKYNTNFIKNKDSNRVGPGMEKTPATDEKQTKKPEEKASSTSMTTFTQDEMADIEKTLQMIAKFMKEYRLDFERVFCAMDCNGDGTITENDFTAVLSSLKIDKSLRLDLLVKYLKNGRTNIDLKTLRKHLNPGDKNDARFANPDGQKPSPSANERNNGVPRDENGERAFYLFKEALRRQRIEPKKAFEIFDRNRNGTIEFSEFYHALELLGADLEAEEKNYIFRKLDIKVNGRIERDDFLRCFETGPTESNNERNEMASYNVSETRGSYYQPHSPEREGWRGIVTALKPTQPEGTRATKTYKSLKEVLISQRINPEEAFRIFDRNNTGFFGFHEFNMGLEKLSINLDRADVGSMFSELDIQRRNRVSRSEFLQYFDTTSPKEHDDNSRAGALLKDLIRQMKLQAGREPLDVFKLMDRQRRGQVDFNDFQRFVLDIYPRFTRDEVMSIFRLIDENTDGLISFEEFKKHFSDNQPERGKTSSPIEKFKVKLGLNSREKILVTWRRLDADANKSITQKEFGIGIKRISSDFSDSELDQIFRELAGADNAEAIAINSAFTQDETTQIGQLLSQVAEFMKEDNLTFEKLFVSKDKSGRGAITENDFKTVLCNDLKMEQSPKLDLLTKYLTNEQGDIILGTLQRGLKRQAEEAPLVLTADKFLEKLNRRFLDTDHTEKPNNREPRRTFTRDEMAQIEKMFEEIAKFMRVDRLDFDRLFTRKDYRGTGTITEREFENILFNELYVSRNPTLGQLVEFVKTKDGNIDLAILKRHLNLDQGQVSRGSANQFDYFVKALKQRFNSPTDMMRFFDPDNNRYINKRAFVLCCQRGLNIDQEEALSYFSKLDRRNNGEISVNDLRDAIEIEGRTKGANLSDQARGGRDSYYPPETSLAARGHDSYYRVTEMSQATRGSYGSRPRDRRDRGRNNQEALAMYDRILSANPNDSEASYGKGLVLLDIGRREDGMKSLARAIELDPKNAEFFNTKGEKLLEEGQFKEAVEAYDQAIKLDPKHLIAYSNKGFALYKLGKIEEAFKLYDKQLELNPDDWASFAKKGQALHDQNKISEAKEYFEKAMKAIDAGELEGNLFTPLNGHTILLNTLELELIASIKELLKLPNLQPNQAPSAKLKHAIQDANNKKEALKLKLINAAYDSKQDSAKENEVETLQRELADLKRMFSRLAAELEEVKADLRDAGIRELAEVKRGFRELEDKDPELLAYCKTFYWTAINLFGAYRALSSGVIKGNLSGEETNTDSLLAKGLKAATSTLSNVAQGVPFAGGVLGLIDSVVDGIFEAVKENRLENKVNAINKIIRAKLGTEDDISLNVSKVALAMTRVKEQAILYPDIPAPCSSKVKAGLQWLEEKVDKIKDKVLPSIELHDKESHGAVLALQDVALFMAFMYKSHESIIKRKEKLDKQLESIVKYGGLDQLLENMSDIPSDKGLANSRSSCCTMF